MTTPSQRTEAQRAAQVSISKAEFEEMQAALAKANGALAKVAEKTNRSKTIAKAKSIVLKLHLPELVAECKRLGVEYNPES